MWLTRPQLRCEARVRAFAVPAPAPQPCPAACRTSASLRDPTRHGHAARLHRTPELQRPREGHPALFQRLRPPPRDRPQKWVRFRGVRGLPRRRRRRLRAKQQGTVRRARDRRARPGPAPRPRWLQLRKPQWWRWIQQSENFWKRQIWTTCSYRVQAYCRKSV